MFCHKCGKELLKNAKFCSYCGEKINEMEIKEKELPTNRKLKNQKNNKKIYIIWFIILILPPIINRFYPIFNTESAKILTIITKITVIILTAWYASKLKINIFLIALLSLGNLLPFGAWISFIILLLIKEKYSHTINDKTISQKTQKKSKSSNDTLIEIVDDGPINIYQILFIVLITTILIIGLIWSQ